MLLPLLDRWRGLRVTTRDAFLAAGLRIVAVTPSSSGLGMDLPRPSRWAGKFPMNL